MPMFVVVLLAEDGRYVLTSPMPEIACERWADAHESEYGEGQELIIERVNGGLW